MTKEELMKLQTYKLFEDEETVYVDRNDVLELLEQGPCEDIGEMSDGYHTFNQLYHQRAVLFAALVNQNREKSWKSFKHSDGKYCFDRDGEWFIVGIDTPKGSYTYHYKKKYWDMFECKELECGKEWDGHTEEDVTRLLSLDQEPCEDAISRADAVKVASGYCHPANIAEELAKLPPVTPKQKTECSCAQIKWERNMAIVQLNELGYGLGEKPKTAHWILLDKCANSGYYCSKCHEKVVKEGWSDTVKKIKYCPNCGKRIINLQESEDKK